MNNQNELKREPFNRLETVTPSRAIELLNNNLENNRTFSQVTIDQYAQIMLKGEWKVG